MTIRSFLFYVFPLLLWMLIIFSWSTDFGSSQHTGSLIDRIFATVPVLRELPAHVIEGFKYSIRKTAHISEYAILAVLASRAIRRGRTATTAKDIWMPVLLCFLYASTDEYHQSFVPSRFASIYDVMYDTFGGIVGVGVSWALSRARQWAGA